MHRTFLPLVMALVLSVNPALRGQDTAQLRAPSAEGAENVRAPDVVFVPTPQDVVDKMLELANVQESDLLYDLGCGDGRIVVAAAKKYGKAAGILGFKPEQAPGFLAEGGDLYTVFAESEAIGNAGKVSDVVAAYFAQHDEVAVPSRRRQMDAGSASPQ